MKVSVVVPLYDEEDNVRPFMDELMPILDSIDPEGEVVLVDDGSKDATPQRIAEVCRLHPGRVRHIELLANTGQTAALDAGFRAARGELIAMMDGDLQVDPRDLPMMIAAAADHDLVHGWRWQRQDTGFKRVQTRIANAIRNRLTRSDVHDTGCPLKVFRREVLQQLKLYTGMHRFFVTLARMEGFRTLEVKVHHRHRYSGRSKYGMWNRAFRALRDLFAVRWMMARSYRLRLRERTEEWVGAAAAGGETRRFVPSPVETEEGSR